MKIKIQAAISNDSFIRDKVKDNHIKLYESPSTDLMEPHIVIDPLDVPLPGDYGDNQWLTEDHMLQIEVWSKSYYDTEALSKRIRDIMWEQFGFPQGPGMDEYDSDYKIYRDARRYRGKAYVN
ncbi:hypothetical protein [Virgibacillus kimchii]